MILKCAILLTALLTAALTPSLALATGSYLWNHKNKICRKVSGVVFFTIISLGLAFFLWLCTGFVRSLT